MSMMFKKLKPNIRKRRDSDVAEGHNDEESQKLHTTKSIPHDGVKVSSGNKKEKSKEKKTKKVSLLSFDDGEEEDVGSFKVKKSSRSKRIAKQIKKRSQEEKEAMGNENAKSDPKLAKQPSGRNSHIFQPKKKESNGTEGKENAALSKPDLDVQIANLNSGAIPTPSMIHAARKQREMLRKFGSEFISMEDTQKYKEQTQSRLVREDDDDSSEDGIMEMKGIEKNKPNSSKLYVPNESDDNVDSEEEENADEEVHRWEEEMIKKGINLQPNQSISATQGMNAQQPNTYNNYNYANASSYYTSQNQVSTSELTHRTVEAKTNVTIEFVKKRLENHLSSLKEKNRSHQMEMDGLLIDTSECSHMSKNLSDTAAVSSEYQFYQEIREYIKDLVGCLREYMPAMNTLEENAFALWKNQSARLVSRRIQDVQDESSQATSSGNKSIQEKNNCNDSDLINRVREREARRTRRRATRQIQQTSAVHYDGTSTDDEETSMDQAQHNTELNRIQTACNSLFDDVVEEFCVLKHILQRFVGWREKQSNSYNDAYIALCIPKLVIPFIRYKMILWNPLLSSTRHFEEEDWFRELSVYGLQNYSTEDEDSNANMIDDTKVLSSVVEKVLVSKLQYFVQNAWDPLSSQQTIRLTLLLKELTMGYPCMSIDNITCQRMMQAICKRLQSTLDNDIFIPLLPPSSQQDSAHLFLDRQTWTCIKLFRNAMLFDGLLSYEILCEMAFDALLNRYIMLALQTSVLNLSCFYKCQKIIDSIPKTWFDLHEGVSSHLSSLSRFLVHFAQSIKASGQLAGKTMIKQIKTMLLVIGARDALSQL